VTGHESQVTPFHLLAASLSSLCAFSTLVPFVSNSLQPLFAKHPAGYQRFLPNLPQSRCAPSLVYPERLLRRATRLPRVSRVISRYRFRNASTASLLRRASLPATIAGTHRIAFSGVARLSIRQVETAMATIN